LKLSDRGRARRIGDLDQKFELQFLLPLTGAHQPSAPAEEGVIGQVDVQGQADGVHHLATALQPGLPEGQDLVLGSGPDKLRIRNICMRAGSSEGSCRKQ